MICHATKPGVCLAGYKPGCMIKYVDRLTAAYNILSRQGNAREEQPRSNAMPATQ